MSDVTPERIEEIRKTEYWQLSLHEMDNRIADLLAYIDAHTADATLGARVRKLAHTGICEYVALADCGDVSFVARGVNGFNDVPLDGMESAPTLDEAVAEACRTAGLEEQ